MCQGKLKEAAGAVMGDESLKQEGQAQQKKAGAQREVAGREAQADKARAQAKAAEAEQRTPELTQVRITTPASALPDAAATGAPSTNPITRTAEPTIASARNPRPHAATLPL